MAGEILRYPNIKSISQLLIILCIVIQGKIEQVSLKRKRALENLMLDPMLVLKEVRRLRDQIGNGIGGVALREDPTQISFQPVKGKDLWGFQFLCHSRELGRQADMAMLFSWFWL